MCNLPEKRFRKDAGTDAGARGLPRPNERIGAAKRLQVSPFRAAADVTLRSLFASAIEASDARLCLLDKVKLECRLDLSSLSYFTRDILPALAQTSFSLMDKELR